MSTTVGSGSRMLRIGEAQSHDGMVAGSGAQNHASFALPSKTLSVFHRLSAWTSPSS